MRQRRSVTIRDVASEAQVAVATASRALSGRSEVSDETRKRVERAAKKLGYVPNQSARSLRAASTRIIGVVVPSMANPIYELYLRGAAHEAVAHGYSIFICDAEYDPALYRTHLRTLLEHRVDGVIIGEVIQAPSLLVPFLRAGIPVDPSEAARRGAQLPQLVRGTEAFKAAYTHLLSLGHERIAYARLTRPGIAMQRVGSDARMAWLQEAAAEAGLPDDAVVPVEFVPGEETSDRLLRLLSSGDRPTALVVTAPLLQPVLVAIHETGLEIPRDLSLLMVGDASWARAVRPPIASVSSDMYEEGMRALRRMVGRIQGDADLEAEGAPQPARFLPRGSLGPVVRLPGRVAPGAPQKTTRAASKQGPKQTGKKQK
ncbi:MAG: LacI family transcriptional regulator [Dehalococcoidia bacterium]|nr:LacI family transcriptional regulator [Dehalococcoidia bacterium]